MLGQCCFARVIRARKPSEPSASTRKTACGVLAHATISVASTSAGLYAWANVVAAHAFESLPEREIFCHFGRLDRPPTRLGRHGHPRRNSRVRRISSGNRSEPPPNISRQTSIRFNSPIKQRSPTRSAPARAIDRNVVIGAGAELGARSTRLRRAVVWDGERVPDGLEAKDGVFAGGVFHPVR